VKGENPDLILTGLQSDDLGSGQTGVVMAELLGVPHSTIIMQVEVDGARIQVNAIGGRLVSAHWHAAARGADDPEWLEQLRYATLMGIKKAQDERDSSRDAGGSGRLGGPGCSDLQGLRAAKAETSSDFRGRSEDGGGAVGRKLKFEVRVI